MDFTKCIYGDKVISKIYGKGKIIATTMCEKYPIVIDFNGRIDTYTYDGRIITDACIIDLKLAVNNVEYKINDRVISKTYDKGVIFAIMGGNYPLRVRFDNKIINWYSIDGKSFNDNVANNDLELDLMVDNNIGEMEYMGTKIKDIMKNKKPPFAYFCNQMLIDFDFVELTEFLNTSSKFNWHNYKKPYEKHEVIEVATRVLYDSYKHERTIGSAGFNADIYKPDEEDDTWQMNIKFVLEDIDLYDDDYVKNKQYYK